MSSTSGVVLQGKKTASVSPAKAMKTRQVPIIPVSHIPRAIRLVATPTTGQKSRQKPPLTPLPPLDGPSTSTAISPFVPHPLALWEEPAPATFYMDFGGHCHKKLDDGGFLFMDQFGHCHTKLDDGGFLYMDRQGSGHKSLDDGEVGQHHPPPRPGRTLTVSAMLGTPETAKATRQSLASHDGEVRQMQAKATMFKGKAHTQKPNASTRKLHHIGQPRRHN
eukprot:jgi/Tetstr1/431622/TSEL_021152.t1